MSDLITVSVIVPVYNGAAWLEIALKSVLSQSLSNIEIIVVDDGSSDGSPDILNRIAREDARVLLLRQPNAGSGAARNAGLERAKGEHVAFLDADDWYPDENVLKTLYDAAEKNGASITGGSFCIFENGKVQTKFSGTLAGYVFDREGFVNFRKYQFDYGYQRFLFRRSLLEQNGICFPEYRRYQDPPFLVRAMLRAGQFYAVRNIVYCYRSDEQKIIWDARKTEDLALGLIDCMRLADENGLEILRENTRERVEGEYEGIFLNQLRRGNARLYALLMELGVLAGGEILRPLRLLLDAYAGTEGEEKLMERLKQLESEVHNLHASKAYRLSSALIKPVRALRQRILRGRYAP